MKDRICYIAGAGDGRGAVIKKRPGDMIIAADAGLLLLMELGETPDLTVGDFDSLRTVPFGDNVIRHPPEKNDTDMLLAVNEGLKRGYTAFSVLGGLGGRLDHTLANIQTLVYIAEHNAVGFLSDAHTVITVVKDCCVRFPAGMSGYISVFCAGDRAEGVYLTGLKYPLNNAVLTCGYPLGVSNEFTGETASVSVKNGVLVVSFCVDGFCAGETAIEFGR